MISRLQKYYFFGMLWAYPVSAAASSAKYPTQDVAKFVIHNLDVTSFRSSIGPRQEKGKIFFKDYDLITKTITDKEGVLEASGGSWRFTIKVLKTSHVGILVCIEDEALNGGTYHTQEAFLLTKGDDRSPLKAAKNKVSDGRCLNFPN